MSQKETKDPLCNYINYIVLNKETWTQNKKVILKNILMDTEEY